MSNSLAKDLVSVESRGAVRIDGYPEGETLDWHVNKRISIGSPASKTIAVILQKADASEVWLAAVIVKDNGEWKIDMLSAFEGEPPRGIEPDEHGDELDPESLEVVGYESP